MRTEDYLEQVLKILKANPLIVSYDVKFEIKSSTLALLFGEVLFKDGSTLEFLELIRETYRGLERLKYRFQYMKGKILVFRYDNAPHHKEVDTFPHHKHIDGKVIPSTEKNLLEVLKEIEDYLY